MNFYGKCKIRRKGRWQHTVMGSTFIRDAVVIAFIVNETISIVENAGLMGVPIPAAITKAIDILKQKAEEERQEEG